MKWSLYSKNEKLAPLCFSNNKTQEDVVNEVLEAIKENKIIFIRGKCGTGKSAIALNIAKEMKKSSIVVPGKNLQAQYKKDYEKDKYLKKKNGEKLKISVLTGRKNHICKYIQDNSILREKKEINAKLHDIFEGKRENRLAEKGKSADNSIIPCKIPITEKNWKRIIEYLKQNPRVNEKKFDKINDIRRASVASTCPYWSPVLPKKYEFKILSKAEKITYVGLNGEEFIQYKRKPGCPYYEQFDSYIKSDVIVFNSMKYKLESALNRKPLTDIEIIDECDEFLDGLSNSRTINIDRFQNSIFNALNFGDMKKETGQIIIDLIKNFKKDRNIKKAINTEDIIPLKKTGIYDLLKMFLHEEIMKVLDQESYLMEIIETAHMFKDFFDESYITINRHDDNLFVNIVTINLSKKFEEIVSKNKRILLMSGTIHSEEILKNVFGIEKFKIIEAETSDPGKITVQRTGFERDCKYSNFSNGNITREEYLNSLDLCVSKSKKPALIHVNAYSDLPTEDEIDKYNLKNLPSRRELRQNQIEDGEGKILQNFKKGNIDVLFSTRDSRGVDFPGKECNSIVFTKYPNPNVKDPFWKILMKTNPSYYWILYKDKARRELLQKLYRGLRFQEDHVYVLSPDSRILDFFEKRKKGE